MKEQISEIIDRVAIGIAQIDPNGGYLLASEHYCEMLGRNQHEVLRAQLQDFVYHEDLPTALEGFIRVLETGEPGVIDHRVTRGDGSIVWLGNTVSAAR